MDSSRLLVLYRRARCRAQECLYGPSDSIYTSEIHDKYRVALDWDGRPPLNITMFDAWNA
ncbi:unnamed protein product [Clonostachys chloroleuca]|uniref:Uncharacterized protein n=1 Tax=Clonostachys chloroleuca TaxID=1926264 RepID=A0AA35Q3N0_9HYPO|nr:unnamed protein product [Clonostachys chloroleuca]